MPRSCFRCLLPSASVCPTLCLADRLFLWRDYHTTIQNARETTSRYYPSYAESRSAPDHSAQKWTAGCVPRHPCTIRAPRLADAQRARHQRPGAAGGDPPVCPAPGTGDTRDERPSHAPRTRTRSPPRSPRRVGLPSGRCAAAFFRISRSSPRIRTARRRRGSSCSSLVSPSLRLPSSRSACLSHRRNVSPVMPRSSAIWRCGLPLPRASRIASARNASGAGCTGRDALTLDTSSDLLGALAPTLPVSTKAGQLQPAHPPGNQTSGDRLPLDRHRRFLRWEFTI